MKKLILCLALLQACASAPEKQGPPELIPMDKVMPGWEAMDRHCESRYYKARGVTTYDMEVFPFECLQPLETFANEQARQAFQMCFENSFIDQGVDEATAKTQCEVESRRVYYDQLRRQRRGFSQ